LTVSETEVVCTALADVAVIVTVDVTGVEPEPPPLPPPVPPPPQPKVSPSPTRMAARMTYCGPRRFFLIKRHRPTAKAVNGRNGREFEAVELEPAEIVSEMLAAAPEGVTVVGLKEQVAPAGSPEQAKVTVALNAYIGVTVSETVPEAPDPMAREEGETPRVKFGGGGFSTTRATVVVSVTPAFVPVTVSV
jgi:hypothetical protein